MLGVLLAVTAAGGVHLLHSALATGRRDVCGSLLPAGRRLHGHSKSALQTGLQRAGLGSARPRDVAVLTGGAALLGLLVGLVIFGAALPAVVLMVFVAIWPVAGLRARSVELRRSSNEAWPTLLETMRLGIVHSGQSVPKAVFEAGRGAPPALRPAFEAAEHEWALSTNFERTIAVLKSRLADPTADAACETLLVAHDLGGTDVDRRLAALIDDRLLDVQGRKDGKSRQAGAVFARRFVLLVPLGMALVGMSIGTGRQAYATAWGQVMVAFGIGVVAFCWVWAGRLMKLPEERRVFRAPTEMAPDGQAPPWGPRW
jgi:tight adherence protein B